MLHRPRVPTEFHSIDSAIRNLTAFRSLAHLKAHHRETGWAPSFRSDNVAGVALGAALIPHGVLCRYYT
jgi:hypothetical protein